jgi:hypothetical protein
MSSPIGHVLGIGHIVVGAGAIIAPFTAAQAFRIVPATSTAFITRAFGSRDLVTGLGIQLYDRTTPENRAAVLACGVFHAIDVVNALVSYAQGYLPFEALIVAGGIDTMLVGLCWWELNS